MGNTSAQADAAISEVKRAFHDGLTRVGFSPADAVAIVVGGPIALVGLTAWTSAVSLFSDSAKDAIEKNMRDLQPRIEAWATTRRGWAESGRRADGSSYAWPLWFDEGKSYADAIGYHTGELANVSLFKVVADTVSATKDQVVTAVAGAAKPLESVLDHLHIIAVGAGACAVAYVVWRFAR